ncbi:aminopeptidase P family N-terminal domain-containing protein [Bradyrhizobium sp. ISRA442]|uniref:aminopeptidase P family N-terminal domain-containing protein n=1 Tax=Bradyrhizobium sp. ISRA442 TaxID=2866197 RepID=UPI00311AC95F
MAQRGIDLLLVASPANQFWLTVYDGWSFYTPQMVVVSQQEEAPIWIGRGMDAVGAKFTAFFAPKNVVPYPDQYVGSSERHPMQFVSEELQRRRWVGGRIGVETDDYYYTAKWEETFRMPISSMGLAR